MLGTGDSLLRDGLVALSKLLPPGFTIGRSGLKEKNAKSERWVVIGRPNGRPLTCLVLARRRVEARDVGVIAAHIARSRCPVLLVAPSLSAEILKRLRGFGIGSWDLLGNALIELRDLDLSLRRQSESGSQRNGDRTLRSLAGEMSGRMVRALVDIAPPYGLAQIAECARVEMSCASRVTSMLTGLGLVRRRLPRGKIETVEWQAVLRRWASESPPETRGQRIDFVYGRGIADFLDRLRTSGFLHALTGTGAFAMLARAHELPPMACLYVDDVAAAVAQFGLHPVEKGGNITLIKPIDRSVFVRSEEVLGLRQVSPSLMAADLSDRQGFDHAIAWMSENEASWRLPLPGA